MRDMKGKISIDAETRKELEAVGIRLNDSRIKDLERLLEKCALALECELITRPTADRKKHWREIEKRVRELVECFSDLNRRRSGGNEPFDEQRAINDEILLRGADVDDLPHQLLMLQTYFEEDRDLFASGGRPPNYQWGRFLASLATLFRKWGGLATSAGSNSLFIKFAWRLTKLLPRRPHSPHAFAKAWERYSKDAPAKAPKRPRNAQAGRRSPKA
jgi:hypothetical protein